MRVAVLMLLGALLVQKAVAAPQVDGVVVEARQGWIACSFHVTELLDERTTSTVASGLSGTCLFRLAIVGADDRVLGQRAWQWRISRDLWEDRYTVEGGDDARTFASLAQADSFCAQVQRMPVISRARLKPADVYRVAVSVVVQPLGAEDQDRLSQYVSRKGGDDREEVDLDLGAFLGGLFGKGSTGRERVSYVGSMFRPAELEERP